MEIIKDQTIIESATLPEWVDAMGNALVNIDKDGFLLPKRMHIDSGKNTFLLMPCISDKYWTTKLVATCPDNALSGHPSIYGTVILNNSRTGEPLAIMDGGLITAMRTAAVSACGIRHLSSVDCHSLGVIGTGKQGLYQTIFACSVRQIWDIWVFDLNEQRMNQFLKELEVKLPEIKVHKALDSSEVALNSEIVITSSTSQSPVFRNSKELFTGKTFIGIGSYKPDSREFPEQLFRQLDHIFVDTLDAKFESGDIITPINEGWISDDKIYQLGKVCSGAIKPSSNRTRLFKTVGSAIFDLFAARLVYEKHLEMKGLLELSRLQV
jgi:ornithine cyclodeaminase/alanine dehydrogenase-like protein (mu-crystallin family)